MAARAVPELDGADVQDATDALVRLAVSHLGALVPTPTPPAGGLRDGSAVPGTSRCRVARHRTCTPRPPTLGAGLIQDSPPVGPCLVFRGSGDVPPPADRCRRVCSVAAGSVPASVPLLVVVEVLLGKPARLWQICVAVDGRQSTIHCCAGRMPDSAPEAFEVVVGPKWA